MREQETWAEPIPKKAAESWHNILMQKEAKKVLMMQKEAKSCQVLGHNIGAK